MEGRGTDADAGGGAKAGAGRKSPRVAEAGRRAELMERLIEEVRASQNATDLMDEAACERLGVNRTDARCIDLLERRGPMTAGELAGAAGLTSGALTTALDRLERAGYARRTRDSGDRRRVLVEVTPEARRRTQELYGPLGERGQDELSRYSVAELELVCDFLRLSRELNEQRAAELREGGGPSRRPAAG